MLLQLQLNSDCHIYVNYTSWKRELKIILLFLIMVQKPTKAIYALALGNGSQIENINDCPCFVTAQTIYANWNEGEMMQSFFNSSKQLVGSQNMPN